MPKSPRFWNLIAKHYSRKPITDEASYQKKIEFTRAYFNPDTLVLELACGTGSTAILHAPYVKHICAIDISPTMIKIAQNKADAANINNINFEVATIEALNLPNKSFDVVMAMSILHLLENKEAALTKVKQLLKPEGVFVSSTACLGSIPGWLKPLLKFGGALGLLPYVQFFTKMELEQAIIEAGFNIEQCWQPNEKSAVFIIASKRNV